MPTQTRRSPRTEKATTVTPKEVFLLVVLFLALGYVFQKFNSLEKFSAMQTPQQEELQKNEEIKRKAGVEILTVVELTTLRSLAEMGDKEAQEAIQKIVAHNSYAQDFGFKSVSEILGVVFDDRFGIKSAVKRVLGTEETESSFFMENGVQIVMSPNATYCVTVESLTFKKFFASKIEKFDYDNKVNFLSDTGRFLFVETSNYGKVFVGGKVEAHRDLNKLWWYYGGLSQDNRYPIAGGYYQINHQEKTITLSGESVDFGKGDHEATQKFLEENIPSEYHGYIVAIRWHR